MLASNFTFINEESCHQSAVNALNAAAFGPGRHARAAARIREQGPHDFELSFVCLQDGKLIGSVRMTPIWIGEVAAYLLGPLAVHPDFKSKGVGRKLLEIAGEATKKTDASGILLVGDESYYAQSGYSVVDGDLKFPGPVDPTRVLYLPLRELNTLKLDGKVRFRAS